MSARKFDVESLQRALMHHELTGAIRTSSKGHVGRPKWRVVLHDAVPDGALDLTTREVYVLCLGLAAAEHASKQPNDKTKGI